MAEDFKIELQRYNPEPPAKAIVDADAEALGLVDGLQVSKDTDGFTCGGLGYTCWPIEDQE